MRIANLLTFCAGAAVLIGCSGSGPSAAESKKAETPSPATYFKVDPATAGSISGKISWSGAKPAPKKIVMNEEAECVKMHPGGLFAEDLVVNADGTLANVFVYLKTGMEGKNFEPVTVPVAIDQKGCRFVPHIMAVRVGQPFHVTNSDSVTHNIHPQPKDNREWNQGQTPGAAPLEREFARPEIMIPVKCNVHSWMRSYIAVMAHPYFAVAGDGTFEIKDVPAGEYTVEAWHEKLGTQERKVTVAPSGKAVADFIYKGA